MVVTRAGRLQEYALISGRGRLWELFITKFKSQFKWGFAKVVITRAGRLREWSQGELQLYILYTSVQLFLLIVVKWALKMSFLHNVGTFGCVQY